MKLRKQIRHKIYLKALERLNKAPNTLCCVLRDSIEEVVPELNPTIYDVKGLLKEFKRFDPKLGIFKTWFPLNRKGWKQRILILEFCITMTES